MARRRKPADPAAITRAMIQRRENEEEARRLRAQGATVSTDPAGRVISAYRSNVFTILLQRKAISLNHHNAAYDLAKDWAQWKGLDGKGDRLSEVVDGGAGCAEIVTDRMIRGGRRVAEAMRDLEARQAKILCAFMVATVEEDRPMAWRGIMERLGLKDSDRQTEAVVGALEALRVAYEGPARRAA